MIKSITRPRRPAESLTEHHNGEKTLATFNKGVFIGQMGQTRWAGLNISDTTDLLGFSCRVCREWPEKEKSSSEWHFRRKGPDCLGLTERQQPALFRQTTSCTTLHNTMNTGVDGLKCICSNALVSLLAISLNQDKQLYQSRHSVRCIPTASTVTGSQFWKARWGCGGEAEELQLNCTI